MVAERAAVAAFQLALMTLIECAELGDIDLTDLAVNIDCRSWRIDIARLTPDGQHVAEWVKGWSINPNDLEAFGRPVDLPRIHRGATATAFN